MGAKALIRCWRWVIGRKGGWREAGSGVEVPGMLAGDFSCRLFFLFSFSVRDLKSEQRESCSSRLAGQVDRVRDQENEGSIGSFVYIECDRVRKCIRLPSSPRPHSAMSTVPTPFCFPEDRQYVGDGGRGRETERGKGNMFRRK